MDALAVTALTDFLLACEGFFLAGLLVARPKVVGCAAWFWQWALFLIATGALLGGIDHGFVEPVAHLHATRTVVQRATWLAIGLGVWAVVMTIGRQFLDGTWRRIAFVAAGVQLAGYTLAVLLVESFAVVIVNYVPVMLLLLVLNVRGLRSGRGSWPMVLGIVVAFVAAGLQAGQVNVLAPLNGSGLYHVVMMPALLLFYRAGLRLEGMGAGKQQDTSRRLAPATLPAELTTISGREHPHPPTPSGGQDHRPCNTSMV
jgi:hypothetical protein